MNLFATHPLGFSDLIEQEVLGCGGAITARTTAGIGFSGGLECAYRMCLWSRVANRILLQIDAFDAAEPDALYYGIQRTDWLAHLDPAFSLAVAGFPAKCKRARASSRRTIRACTSDWPPTRVTTASR